MLWDATCHLPLPGVHRQSLGTLLVVQSCHDRDPNLRNNQNDGLLAPHTGRPETTGRAEPAPPEAVTSPGSGGSQLLVAAGCHRRSGLELSAFYLRVASSLCVCLCPHLPLSGHQSYWVRAHTTDLT